MAEIDVINESTIKIKVQLDDAVRMVNEATRNVASYAHDIVTIYEKMPAFDYTSFCFYAYNSAKLFEFALETNPKEYTSFSLDAPDSFFYTLYGGMTALYETSKGLILEESA